MAMANMCRNHFTWTHPNTGSFVRFCILGRCTLTHAHSHKHTHTHTHSEMGRTYNVLHDCVYICVKGNASTNVTDANCNTKTFHQTSNKTTLERSNDFDVKIDFFVHPWYGHTGIGKLLKFYRHGRRNAIKFWPMKTYTHRTRKGEREI